MVHHPLRLVEVVAVAVVIGVIQVAVVDILLDILHVKLEEIEFVEISRTNGFEISNNLTLDWHLPILVPPLPHLQLKEAAEVRKKLG